MTAAALGDTVNVSESTVVRFATPWVMLDIGNFKKNCMS